MEPATPVPEKKIGKFRASYLLATESFELFRKDKEIAWFVVWNLVGVLLTGVVFLGVFFGLIYSEMIVLPEEGEVTPLSLHIAGYASLFLFYVITAYITTFFGVALTSVVAARIEGENKSFDDGIRVARMKAGRIFGWSLLSSTVGLILQIIADKASWAGKLFSWLGGVAWAVATFFIIPVIAREEVSVIDAVKRSTSVFVAKWGETLIMNFSLGLFFGALHVVLLVVFAVLAVVMSTSMPALILLLIVYVVLFLGTAVLQAVLEAVFKVVLYEYATRETVPDSFTPELIMGALTKKKV